MTFVDNGAGSGFGINQGEGAEYNLMLTVFQDSVFHGESLSPDCPQASKEGTFCAKVKKGGLFLSCP
jgi:hypothetical protein